jgi:hypothetical protein
MPWGWRRPLTYTAHTDNSRRSDTRVPEGNRLSCAHGCRNQFCYRYRVHVCACRTGTPCGSRTRRTVTTGGGGRGGIGGGDQSGKRITLLWLPLKCIAGILIQSRNGFSLTDCITPLLHSSCIFHLSAFLLLLSATCPADTSAQAIDQQSGGTPRAPYPPFCRHPLAGARLRSCSGNCHQPAHDSAARALLSGSSRFEGNSFYIMRAM